MLVGNIRNLHQTTIHKEFKGTDIQSTNEINNKLKFLELNQEDLQRLRHIKPEIDALADEITHKHYHVLQQFDELNAIIRRHSSVEKLSKTFSQYLRTLGSITEIDKRYINNRVRIGEMHARIKLTPEWYTGAYIRVYEFLIPIIIKKYYRDPEKMTKTIMSLLKVITLDSQIVLQSYQEAMDYKNIDGVSTVLELITRMTQAVDLIEAAKSTQEEAISVSSSTEQLSASVHEVAKNATNVAESSEAAVSQAEKGQEIIENSLDKFILIGEQFKEAKASFDKLFKEINSINEIIRFISNVAEQTNLLALNASIEAARAGEHGRGFAVVASEVRKLAEQTKQSVVKISNTISTLQHEAIDVSKSSNAISEAIDEGVGDAKISINYLKSIISDIREIGGATGNIAAIAEQQSAATSEIANRVAHVSDLSDETQQGIVDFGSNLHKLSRQVNELRLYLLSSIGTLQDRQLIRVAKTDHLLWKWWIYNSFMGYESLNPEDVANHLVCRLGNWYYNEAGENVKKTYSYQSMEGVHIKVHELAKEALAAHIKGDNRKANERLEQLEQVSFQLIHLLDELENEISQQVVQNTNA
ncbi:methyl-accepting chemotaxis protein [Microaerobacter geothermalis]|uniref:protoglobin domain-containing protein n=1 Tax=Microaerobacter geothermalis TaxID=674972 RepID=UPI001F30287C|nr:protoglobin domain-containing protein [Microaerobacter geothermalis]MCF6094549.1 methyl-accepting chemotaxis protein [Microaerobacter geothermalis]